MDWTGDQNVHLATLYLGYKVHNNMCSMNLHDIKYKFIMSIF